MIYKDKYALGNPDEMFCGRLKETLAQRDTWIRKWGLRTLILDYDRMESKKGKESDYYKNNKV